MKHFYLKASLLCIFVLIDVAASAYDCEVDGIYYRLIQSTSRAEVTYRNTYRSTYINDYTGDIVIPESITYNGVTYTVTAMTEYAFYNSYITSVVLPSSITSIPSQAFSLCKRLKEVKLPESVTFISGNAFLNCDSISSPIYNSSIFALMPKNYSGEYTLPEVNTVCTGAFKNCEALTAVTIPESVTSINNGAFSDCTNLTTVTINSNAIASESRSSSWSYSTNPLSNLFGTQVTTYVFGEGVSTIGDGACNGCANLHTVELGSTVKKIGNSAFSGCSNMEIVQLPDGLEQIGSKAFYGCASLVQLNLPQTLTYIGSSAFYNCENLSHVTLPEALTQIGDEAFRNCTSLGDATLPESVTSIGKYAFGGCPGISKPIYNSSIFAFMPKQYADTYTIPDGITTIGATAFSGCDALTSITLPASVSSIGDYAFYACNHLRTVELPKAVTYIGGYAFYGTSISELHIPDNVAIGGSNAFTPSTWLYAKRGSIALLSLWNSSYYDTNWGNHRYLNIYEEGTEGTHNPLSPTTLSLLSTTQTTATYKVENIYPEYIYSYRGSRSEYSSPLEGDEFTVTGFRPEETGYVNLIVGTKIKNPEYSGEDWDWEYYYWNGWRAEAEFTTQAISPSVSALATASSISLTGAYVEGDAHVTAQALTVNGNHVEGNGYTATGLDPQTSFTAAYSITVTYGENDEYNYTYKSDEVTTATAGLTLVTSQPKVVSIGNVIVAAEANLDDEETNVGFEWRRSDWTDDFASNTGGAALYEGTMEGYIRNLYTEKLWKYRAYYLSDSGTYYYGDWVGLDPTNTSYFEPTVHTYEKISVEGNTALVKGYALTGTDKVTVQGFKYWKTVSGGNGTQRRAASVPADAMTIEADGQVMTVSLTGLDYNSTYHYAAFVTTSEGDTFYGEELSFSTGDDPTGIRTPAAEDEPTAIPTVRRGIYTLQGVKVSDDASTLSTLPRGIYIVSGKKVMVK